MSVKTKPYRIYNCDSTGHSSDHQHDKNNRENDGKGNGNGNGNDVVKLQGVSYGDFYAQLEVMEDLQLLQQAQISAF